MRIPDLNVSDAVNRTIRDLEFQRLKLDKQITTGQKITLPEDGGMRLSQAIKLDSEIGRLAQYQRNASYATEFINSGQMNLDNLRELNLRAQEIARSAGSSLSEPATKSFALEANQLVEEALNRINSSQRGHALFGGKQLKPDFSNTDVILGEYQAKTLNFEANNIGQEVSPGVRYLNQGDQVVLSVNGLDYIVEAKVADVQEYNSSTDYAKGTLVKTTELIDHSIITNLSLGDTSGLIIDSSESEDELLIKEFLKELSLRDWSKSPVGQTNTGEDVFLLDRYQLENFTDGTFSQGGHFSVIAKDGALLLHPVDSFEENNSKIFKLKSSSTTSYWEAIQEDTSERSLDDSSAWKAINPYQRISNLSVEVAREEFLQMINSSSKGFSKTFNETDDFISRTQTSSVSSVNSELGLEATITNSGLLEINGAVGEDFEVTANYKTQFSGDNYFPVQLDHLIQEKARLFYPEKAFESLSDNERKLLWDDLQSSDISWELSVEESSKPGQSTLNINHYSSWKRLETYHAGEIVEFEDKLWESLSDENFHHSPDQDNSIHWQEIGSGYEVNREDWDIEHVGSNSRIYFTSPDGKLFENQSDAITHTEKLLVSSLSIEDFTSDDVVRLVKEVPIAVADFSVKGSESEGIVYFDSKSQTYRLSTFYPEENSVSGSFIHGSLKTETDSLDIGDVVDKNGNYFLVLETSTSADVSDSNIVQSDLSPLLQKGTTVFDPSSDTLFLSLGNSIPQQDHEIILTKDSIVDIAKGSFVYAQYEDENGNQEQKYFAASREINSATLNDLPKFIPLGSKFIPDDSLDIQQLSDSDVFVKAGDVVRNSADGKYYKALKSVANATINDLDSPFTSVEVFNSSQGGVWSANHTYFKGQIVLHNGVYYECQTNGSDIDGDSNNDGFNNRKIETDTFRGETKEVVVRPDDIFFIEGLEDTINKESLDVQISNGGLIKNNVWTPLDQQPTQHVFSFSTERDLSAEISIKGAGPGGRDAQVTLMTDANGKVSGLKVSNRGKYFFDINAVPDEYKKADILLPDGQSFSAEIIWGENLEDPGTLEILGFDRFGNTKFGDNGTSSFEEVVVYTSLENGSKLGDTFSFATGSKTFLDHRNSDGKVIGVTYTGSNSNSEFYVGKDTKISSFLDASDNNTAELSDIVNSMIELRDGLSSESPSELSRRVQQLESELIDNEDRIVDKIGDLTSLLVRMESVRAYDEEYHLQLNQKLSKDLDIDLSQAIMELTRISTAYQAAMQVGAQLLNTSLLNYL